MDRERLLQYIDREYLPKRDVLSHIPLGASLDDVWEEVQRERRKKATLLSPMRGSGAAPWFVLTDSMIAASEKIVEEAMLPYHGGSVAELEEAFYTSYIEGSEMTAEEAMAFVKSGAAPGDIHEQMLQNNRQAITFAMANAFQPITEETIRTLAGILTKEMDGGGENYRDSDTHVIPSMGQEPYTVPTAAAIPGLMRDMCQYLASGKNHPLLKAAVAHACLLVYRPFNEGNERLARLVASMILMKAKYTFFNEVSLSAIIAQDGYGYFDAVANTLGEVDGGDMTYLVKFYIETLGKAVDEIHVRRQQREEELARQALKAAPDPPALQTTQTEVNPAPEAVQKDESSEATDEPGEAGADHPFAEHPFPDADTAEDALKLAGFVPIEIPDEMMEEVESVSDADNSEERLSLEELIERVNDVARRAKAPAYSESCQRVLKFIAEGKHAFTRGELTDGIAANEKQACNIIYKLRDRGILLTGQTNNGVGTVYCLNLVIEYSQRVMNTIHMMANSPRSAKDRRIGGILEKKLTVGHVAFEDYKEIGAKDQWIEDMAFAVQLGLVRKITPTKYEINQELDVGRIKINNWQRDFSRALYEAFGQDSFTREMIVSTLDYSESATKATLHTFTLLGILDRSEVADAPKLTFSYQFRVTPAEHPELFEHAA